MRRGGSVSFVVEVKRRRFPQQSATTSDLDRGSASRISPIGVGASSVAPLIEEKRGSDPTIEAAKIAAERFFSKPSSHSVRADNWSDPTAPGFISRLEPARAADVAVQKAAADLIASPPAQPAAQAEKPRSGRVLQSLIVEDPIDVLLRRKEEEQSTRQRPRGPRKQSVIPDGTRAAFPTGSQESPAHKMSAKPSTGFTESPVSTDIVEPGRKLRGRTVVTDPNPAVGTPPGKTVKKKAKAPRRTGGPHRTANEEAVAKQRAQKRAHTRRFDKKGIAKRAVAKKGADKAAVAEKMTIRKGEAKGPLSRPTLAKKRSAARRSATKLATRKIGKTKRSAAGTAKTPTRAAKAARRRARRNR
jgi:DNA-binding protein HU-beta